ncbi:MAG: ADP-ribosylglycohydrolase family protein [Clostridia bacterium]|nr:ADP-ribosylglycohydrolase family protein [Clostridia bacterium]
MVKLNRDLIRDKIHACWIGKNIGGTIGAPYEGKRELMDVQGFSTQKGEPLPNDDLDLQLVWLCALEEMGPQRLTCKELAEYWVSYIPPYWNEYGVGKTNVMGGMLAPMSGEFDNLKWKHSNGAWIRSEIWACLAPGYPEIARRYAFEDACIDHGLGEGTVAEQFTATIESLAFFRDDIRGILEEGLAAIPATSRVAKAVRTVMEGYDAGKDWKAVRQELIDQSADIGWFQAPANIGYCIIGLLYGEGDFKKSICTAVSCGDDTDCTGATVGAFLGILYGSKGIPTEWAEYIGDRIVTCSVNNGYNRVRKITSCSVLTDRVMLQIPNVLFAHDLPTEFTDGETELQEYLPQHMADRKRYYDYDRDPLGTYKPYTFRAYDDAAVRVRVEYDKEPRIGVGESLNVRIIFQDRLHCPISADINLILPEGVDSSTNGSRILIDHQRDESGSFSFTLTANEAISANNRVIAEVDLIGHVSPVLFAIPVYGK